MRIEWDVLVIRYIVKMLIQSDEMSQRFKLMNFISSILFGSWDLIQDLEKARIKFVHHSGYMSLSNLDLWTNKPRLVLTRFLQFRSWRGRRVKSLFSCQTVHRSQSWYQRSSNILSKRATVRWPWSSTSTIYMKGIIWISQDGRTTTRKHA